MKGYVLIMAVAGLTAAASAQTSSLYTTGPFGSNTVYVVQGGTLVNSFKQVNGSESALALGSTLRTLGYFAGANGAEYSLAGSPLGPTYTAPSPGNWYDGTTDGKNNYAFAYASSQLYSFDSAWGSPTLVGTVGGTSGGLLGITYDSSDDTLWGVDIFVSPSRVYHMTKSGTVLGSFATSGRGSEYGIAHDPADGTLWTVDYGTSTPSFHQYSKSGTLLQHLSVSGVTPGGADLLGIEAIPAPGALALLGIGGLAAARRRR